jgi:hypothetical protein
MLGGSQMEWKENYNCHSLNVGGLFVIHVDWENLGGKSGYNVHYGNLVVKDLIPELKTAKRIALRNVKKHLIKTLADLSRVEV